MISLLADLTKRNRTNEDMSLSLVSDTCESDQYVSSSGRLVGGMDGVEASVGFEKEGRLSFEWITKNVQWRKRL